MKTIKTSFIDTTALIALSLTMIQGQKSLMLCWHSFSRWGRGCVAFVFTYKGSEYFIYNYQWRDTPRMTQDAAPKIVDALLTLIFRMR